MLRRPSRRPPAALVLAAALVIGCESPDAVDPDPGPPRPLAHDPTDDWSVTPWWASETEVLHLRANGSFELHPDRNRHRAPVLVGRWSKDTYARMTLETYDALHPERIRVGVDRVGGRLVLRVPDRPVFVQVAAPPRAPEDDVLGAWSAESLTLVLEPGGRYELRSGRGDAHAPAQVAGHVGAWILRDDVITLHPGATTIAPLAIAVRTVDGRRELDCDGVRLRRAD